MVNANDYAALAAYVYKDVRASSNQVPLPPGWTEILYDSNPGFSAGAYKNGNDIVISFKGSDALALNANGTIDWPLTNLPAFLGLGSTQIASAALFYEAIKSANPNANIAFTGHSLGGGLASLMAVYFNRTAVTFDQAPFLATAVNPVFAGYLGLALSLNGIADSDFAGYLSGLPISVAERSQKVTDYYVPGEAVSFIRGPASGIYTDDFPVQIGGGNLVSPVDLHSMNLAAALLMQDQFRTDTLGISTLIQQLFDPRLYSRSGAGDAPDFLTKILAGQIQAGYSNESGPLAQFSREISILIGDGGLAQTLFQSALTASAIEYYQFKNPASQNTLYTVNSGAVHFQWSDIGTSQHRSESRFIEAAQSYLATSEQGTVSTAALLHQDAWHIQTGSSAVVWTASGTSNDVVIGGAGTDIVDAGAGNDVLITGPGNDFLTGGLGNDSLLGGLGVDSYQFTAGDGTDIISDLDGQGSVIFGTALTGGNKVADSVWESADHKTTYTLMGGNLIIGERAVPNGPTVGAITVTGWVNGQLGINLADTQSAAPAPDHTYTGDYIKATDGTSYTKDSDGNYASAGSAPDSQDLIFGSLEKDSMQGGGGNDALVGFAGDDSIDGGTGDDLIMGGYGADTLIGGAGNDEIMGGGRGPVTQPGTTDFTPPSSFGHPEYSRGFSWVIYNPENGVDLYIVSGADNTPVTETTGNLIDGGAGNDHISAGTASDTAHGGDGDDIIVGMGGSDVLFGDAGNDQMQGDGPPGLNQWSTAASEQAGDYMDGGAGDDAMVGEGGDDVMYGDAGNDIIYGDDLFTDRTPLSLHGNDYIDGEGDNDTLVGGGKDDQLFGGDGNDFLYGDGYTSAEVPADYEGNDYLDGEDGNDVLTGGGKDDELFGGEGNDTLLGDGPSVPLAQQGNDYLDGEAGADQLRGYAGDDQLFGGDGNDTLQGDAGNDYIDGEADDDLAFADDGNDTVYGGAGKDELQGGNGDDVLSGDDGDDKLFGQAGNDQLSGGDGADNLQGGDGNDSIDGGAGVDKLLGEAGNDSLDGGDGNDILSGDVGADQLAGGAGNDDVQGGADNDVLDGGSGDDLVFGQAGDDTASGGDGNDQVQGGDGIDAVSGGSGDDIITGDAGNDVLSGDDGRDELQGGIGADSLNGGADQDVLFGQADNDTLDGGSGNDTLQGDDGADTYLFGRGGGKDVIYNYEVNGGSTDVLQFAADVKPTDVIAYQQGLDMVYAIRGTDDSITVKNYFAPTRIVTVNGVTQYYYDYRVEQVKFADGTVWTPTNTPNFYQAQLGGGTTYGGPTTQNDVFGGTVGGDTFAGGYGSDTYLWGLHSGRDTIMENGRTGDVDTVRIDASVNVADVYVAKVGNDAVLRMRTSPDEMVIKNGVSAAAGAFKVVFESDGTTWVLSDVLASLPANAPAMAAAPQMQAAQAFSPQAAITGTSAAETIQGTVNDDSITALAGNDTVYGNAGNDTIDGGTGNDSMIGGIGNDVYIVDSATDVIVEQLGEGTDTIQTALGITTLAANVENVTLTGTSKVAVTGNLLDNILTGNTVNNTLTGGDGNDTLIGGGGTDALVGGKGNDYYVIDDSKDSITENTGEGIDTVEVSFTGYTLGTNIENLVIAGTLTTATGNAFDNMLTGNALDNTITGGAGNDTMMGGAGNDTYTVTESGDVVIENANQGMDTVQSSVTYTLSSDVENLTLTGTVAINGTGNALNNVLTGNSANNSLVGGDGNDTLNGNGGADTLVGGLGDDTYTISSSSTVILENPGEGSDTVMTSATYVLGGLGGIENLTLTGTSAISGTGDGGNNVITGNDGANVLDGGAGTDTLNGGLGNDTLYGSGADQLHGGDGDDMYVFTDTVAGDRYGTGLETGGSGIDTLQSSSNIILVDNTYYSNADQSYHYVGAVENATLTGTGNYSIQGTDSNNVLTGNSGNNHIYSWLGLDKMDGGAGNDTLQGGANSTLIGGSGDDRLESDAGAGMILQGGTGNDWYYWNLGSGTITENAGEGTDTLEVVYPTTGTVYTLAANVENLIMWGGSGTGNSDANMLKAAGPTTTLTGLGGNDTLDGTAYNSNGVDTLVGGLGDDTYIVSVGDVLTENAGEGIDTVQASFTFSIAAAPYLNFENITLTGTASINATGNASANILTGNSGVNVLTGGAGNDIYVVTSGDTVVENAGEGTDTIQTAISYSLASLANVENLELTGTSNVTATGNASNNALTGNSGANTLDGGAGIDTMKGGAGNDVYIVDNTADIVTELTGEGVDTVQASVTYTLAAEVDNIILTGSNAIDATGNGLDNTLTGNSAANVLKGLGGNDTYVINDSLDTVVEASGGGTDTVQSSVDYTLAPEVENLVLTGFGNINGTGNQLANQLTGNGGSNVLQGLGGDDTYFVGFGDTVVEAAGGGIDTVRASTDWTLSAEVENLVLLSGGSYSGTGNALANSITGNASVNTLDGGAGIDTLAGGAGDDTYYVDNTADAVVENAGEGTDTVFAAATYSLSANVENLTLTGSAASNGTGNSLDNTLTGNAGANVLTGGAGNDTYVVGAGDTVVENAAEGTDTVQTSLSDFTLVANVENVVLTGTGGRAAGNTADNSLTSQTAAADTLAGGLGNDSYYVGAEDTVQENAGEGTDTVFSAVTYTLATNVENLVLTGSTAINGTGNSLDNTLTGNTAANVLTGGVGNDTYVVDAGDTVVENAGEGTDTVQSSTTYTLADNVENLVLTGTTAINGTGNAADNAITGNSASNVLDGAGGADTLAGGAGDDTYNVTSASVTVTENAAEGTDVVITYVDNYALGANVENLQLASVDVITGNGNALNNVITGSVADNVLYGLGGDDTLDGGPGADTLVGGTGNDTYNVDSADDVVIENAGEGIDTVSSRRDYTLGANVENLTLAGYGAVSGTGNSLDNLIIGSTIDNIIDGGLGADTMRGGAGDDIYFVDNVGDVIDEIVGANDGNDTAVSTVTYTLGAEVENLTLGGSSAINGTGNSGANLLVGNSAANVLTGAAGDDTLDGGAGADTLDGGSGRDTFVVDNAGDVIASDGQLGDGDTVLSAINYTLTGDMENLQLTDTATAGTGNAYANVLIGNEFGNVLDGGAGADVMLGGLGDDVYIVDDANDWVGEYAGEGFDEVRSAVSYTLGANLEALTLTGSAAINGVGNSAANTMRGNSANNQLSGSTGNDTYLFGRGGAQDVVSDDEGTAGNADKIIFDSGVGTHDVQFVKSGSDLILKIIGTTDQIQVLNYFVVGDAWAIEEIRFTDAPATVVGIADVNSIIAAGGYIT